MDWSIWLFVIAFAVIAGFWYPWRVQHVAQRWARREGLQILKIDYDRPPPDHAWYQYFRGNMRDPRTVVRISVLLQNGQTRHGWALCGGSFFGLWRSTVEVDWDPQP